jgi:hypothetical protein
MMRVFSLLCAATVVIGATLSGGVAQADNLPIEAFYGRYVGSGFTFGDTGYYELKNRDLDVEIGAEKNGFFVAWTTVMRHPNAKKATRKSARISFTPSSRKGIYLQRFAERRVGVGLVWAAITGPMLTVRVLTIQPDGSYVVQVYQRIIFEKGMMLQFRSDGDGQTVRLISARLKKVK